MSVWRIDIHTLAVLVLGIYVACPFLCLRIHKRWGVLAAILGLWLPIEFSLFHFVGVSQTVAIAAGMIAGVLAFRKRPEVIEVRSAFDLRKMSFRSGALHFVWFAVVAVPVGLAIGFIQPAANRPGIAQIPALIAGIFFLNALPEEILFRGIIQHTIESITGSRIGALLVAALIFGAAHLNNGVPLPNYRYFLLATLAGIAYGLAWRRNRNVLTSTITHTLVNTAWRLIFRY